MNPEDQLKQAMRVAYAISFGTAVALAGIFFAYTSLAGGYNILARYGGAVWVFILSLIIALPTVSPAVKRRYR